MRGLDSLFFFPTSARPGPGTSEPTSPLKWCWGNAIFNQMGPDSFPFVDFLHRLANTSCSASHRRRRRNDGQLRQEILEMQALRYDRPSARQQFSWGLKISPRNLVACS